MKQIIFIFMSLLCFSCSSKAQNQTADTNVQSDKKILVAYFSCTGPTENAADAIAKPVGLPDMVEFMSASGQYIP